MTPLSSVAILEKVGAVENGILQRTGFEQCLFCVLAGGIIGADQQIADDGALIVAQRRDRDDCWKATAVLADVSQFIDVLDPARGLENQSLEARRDRSREFQAQRRGTRNHFLRIRNVGRRDLVHHFGGRIAQHALGTDVKDLNDALFVRGNA
jgi:hypothetical protein